MNKIRGLLMVVYLATLAIFVWVNRLAIFSGQSTLDAEGNPEMARFLFVDDLGAPIGVVLLGFLGLLFFLDLFQMAGLRTSSLMESRRQGKEVEAARRLADEAEASRFSALQENLDNTLGTLREDMEARHNAVLASLGEMEDRMVRSGMVVGPGPADDRSSETESSESDTESEA